MGAGPVEIVTIVFPGSNFSGTVLYELMKLVDTRAVTIIDGVFAVRGADGSLDTIELADAEAGTPLAKLSELIGEAGGLVSDEDIIAIADGLEPGSSAAILVFEHTWVIPLRDAIIASDGYLLDTVRVPGPVIDEVLLAAADS